MPEAQVSYGHVQVPVSLPPDVRVRVVPAPTPPPATGDALAIVAGALDAPVGAPPLAEAARGCERAVVVVPDATRPAAADVYLLPVIARLARAGLVPRQISIVVARGIHPVLARDEVQHLVGPAVLGALRVVQSAPDTPELNLPILQDEEVGEVAVHRLVAEAGLVILTGSVAPHHLAGFGGGPKALVPGVASRETVLAAHRLTLRAAVRPNGEVRSLAGRADPNPFHTALLRVARAFGRTWLLNVVLDEDGDIAAAAGGEVGEAQQAAIRAWQAGGPPQEPEPADLVVVGAAPPRDRDLIQAHKALLAARDHARPGAPIVWLARAPAGVGHAALLPWFEIRRLEDHLEALRRDFHPYGLTAYSIRRIARDHPVHVVSEVSRDLLRPMGLLPAKSLEEALRRIRKTHPDLGTCAVLPSPIL